MDAEKQEDPRYSSELVAAVRYLLTVRDPLAEGNYYDGLNKITAEPGETLAIVRHNAYAALENLESQDEETIPEDYLFIEVERRIQQQNQMKIAAELDDLRVNLVYMAAIFGLSVSGYFWDLDILWLGMLLGGLVLLVGIPKSILAWVRRRKTNELLRRFYQR